MNEISIKGNCAVCNAVPIEDSHYFCEGQLPQYGRPKKEWAVYATLYFNLEKRENYCSPECATKGFSNV